MKRLYIIPKTELLMLSTDVKVLSGSGEGENGDPIYSRQRGWYEYENSSTRKNDDKQRGGRWGSLW